MMRGIYKCVPNVFLMCVLEKFQGMIRGIYTLTFHIYTHTQSLRSMNTHLVLTHRERERHTHTNTHKHTDIGERVGEEARPRSAHEKAPFRPRGDSKLN